MFRLTLELGTYVRRVTGSANVLNTLKHGFMIMVLNRSVLFDRFQLVHGPFPCLILTPTNCMEQTASWEANKYSTSQEISRIYWNPKVHYRIHKDLSVSWARSIQSMFPSHFLNIHLNILPSKPGSSKWFFPSGFPTKTLYAPLLSPICATRPAHLILLELITRIIFGEQYRSVKLLIM